MTLHPGLERFHSWLVTNRDTVFWWVGLLSPLVIPWVVVRTSSLTLVFPWGMVAIENWHVTSLVEYRSATSGLPHYLELWSLGATCYGLALVWASAERLGGDQRVTAGLLVLVALAVLWMASGLAVDPNRRAIPLGSLHLSVLAIWAYHRR